MTHCFHCFRIERSQNGFSEEYSVGWSDNLRDFPGGLRLRRSSLIGRGGFEDGGHLFLDSSNHRRGEITVGDSNRQLVRFRLHNLHLRDGSLVFEDELAADPTSRPDQLLCVPR